MNIYLKMMKSSLLLACSTIVLAASASKAQQPTAGQVLATEKAGENCTLTIQLETIETPIVDVTEMTVCDRILPGDTVQLSYTYAISAIEVVPPPTTATVRDLQQGDRACYVQLEDAEGTLTTQFANFDICEQNILNQQVALTYEMGNVLAYDCAGDIECGRTDTVRLISQVETTDISPTTPSETPSEIPPETPSEIPPEATEPTPPSFISDLPNGNYRYWSGTTNNDIVSSEELLAGGGELFLFSKQGSNITGVFGEIDQESLCIEGQINENTVTGIGVQNFPGATIRSANDTFVNFSNTDNLRVRQGRQIDSDTVRYGSIIIDLSELNRINAGTRLPPEWC